MVHPARQELLADKHAAYIVAFSQARSCRRRRRSLAAAHRHAPAACRRQPSPSSSAPALPPLAMHSRPCRAGTATSTSPPSTFG